MRLRICLCTVLLSLSPIILYAQNHDNLQVRELYTKSGMEKQFGELPSALQVMFDQSALKDLQAQKLPRNVLSVMRASIPEAFAPEKLKEVMFAELAGKLTEQDIKEVLRWLDSPEGKKCTRLEEAASAPEAQAEQQQYAALLRDSPPTAERLKVLRELDSALKVTESAVEISINMQVALVLGMIATLPIEQQKQSDTVARELEKRRPELEAKVRSTMLISDLYVYKNLTDAEIEQYTEFGKSPAGSAFSSVVNAAIKKAINEGALRWGKLIGEAVKELKGKSEA
ncbi:exported hypothetical protein [Syntrophobacter sp. SbD1]|nr:exported hypothetical protein [Syntrophobacter sp. SbD1]